MDGLPHLKPSEVNPYTSILDQIRDTGLTDRFEVDISARIADIEERIRTVSSHYYVTKMQELQSAPGVNRALPLLFMTDEMEKSAKLLDKRFGEPLLGYVVLRLIIYFSILTLR
jgi:hypothetical protein